MVIEPGSLKSSHGADGYSLNSLATMVPVDTVSCRVCAIPCSALLTGSSFRLQGLNTDGFNPWELSCVQNEREVLVPILYEDLPFFQHHLLKMSSFLQCELLTYL